MASKGQWTTDFYDCWADPSHCIFTWCCPCFIFGEIAEIVDGGTTSKWGACCIYSCLGGLMGSTYRSKLRQLFSLPEEPNCPIFPDILTHCFCAPCALTQEYRELKNRGLDPSLGWERNVEKWQREGVEPPIIPTMAR